MKESEGPSALAYTVFCDDIRYEVGNKITYAGVYRHRMLLHGDFPFRVPKFCFGVSYIQRSDSLVVPIPVHIFLPGDSLDKPSIVQELPFNQQDFELRKDDWRKSEGLEPEEASGPGYHNIEFPIVVSPLIIARPGVLKVRIVRRDELFRAGALLVQRAAEPVAKSA